MDQANTKNAASRLSAFFNFLNLSTPEAVAIATGLIVLLLFWTHNAEYFWIEATFMIEILVLTFFTRTVSTRYALSLFCQGIFISAGLMLLIWNVAYKIGIDTDSLTWSGRVVPLLEETLKILPVFVGVVVVWRARRFLLNMSDWLVMAVMAGAGFSILEKYFWHNVYFDFTYGPHLGSWYFFPDALGSFIEGEKFGYVGHAAATGLVALGVGLGLYLKASRHTAAKKFWWIVPGILFTWVTIEHMMYNSYRINESIALLRLGGGQMTPWLFILTMVVVLGLDVGLMVKLLKNDPTMSLGFQQAWRNCLQAPGLVSVIKAIKYLRAVNSLAWENHTKKTTK